MMCTFAGIIDTISLFTICCFPQIRRNLKGFKWFQPNLGKSFRNAGQILSLDKEKQQNRQLF